MTFHQGYICEVLVFLVSSCDRYGVHSTISNGSCIFVPFLGISKEASGDRRCLPFFFAATPPSASHRPTAGCEYSAMQRLEWRGVSQKSWVPLVLLVLFLGGITESVGQTASPRRTARPARPPPSPSPPPPPPLTLSAIGSFAALEAPFCSMAPLVTRDPHGAELNLTLPDLDGSTFPTAFSFPGSFENHNCSCPASPYNLFWGADAQLENRSERQTPYRATRRFYPFRMYMAAGLPTPTEPPTSLVIQIDPERALCYDVNLASYTSPGNAGHAFKGELWFRPDHARVGDSTLGIPVSAYLGYSVSSDMLELTLDLFELRSRLAEATVSAAGNPRSTGDPLARGVFLLGRCGNYNLRRICTGEPMPGSTITTCLAAFTSTRSPPPPRAVLRPLPPPPMKQLRPLAPAELEVGFSGGESTRMWPTVFEDIPPSPPRRIVRSPPRSAGSGSVEDIECSVDGGGTITTDNEQFPFGDFKSSVCGCSASPYGIRFGPEITYRGMTYYSFRLYRKSCDTSLFAEDAPVCSTINTTINKIAFRYEAAAAQCFDMALPTVDFGLNWRGVRFWPDSEPILPTSSWLSARIGYSYDLNHIELFIYGLKRAYTDGTFLITKCAALGSFSNVCKDTSEGNCVFAFVDTPGHRFVTICKAQGLPAI
ncbi:hypothetical protein VOLCADRAFT_105429 [Volvox carteri f. nagariensis]|uniref:Uncharacterized protein n=1 Tax=Volvox carteri f. nagariensis TaxID=3068 RepID=D8U0Q8_VOLCA|nr:uncharacterized protein VOLCADRAFT_105429 [Volvox carteri f. nagariensis]EFJ46681.1 hypothetical protein VOLCADRAFT_105429 [Volvox carteri f. nagariensis]|eukprot:XP_002952210.1 hypothetical protein VOLCADRAFT_105429 [Volvox carteri f. nagariensis]